MSKQFNFFAMNEDITVIGDMILGVFAAELFWIPERGTEAVMNLQPVRNWQDLSYQRLGGMAFIVPKNLKGKLVIKKIEADLFVIQPRLSPVFELSPSYSIAHRCQNKPEQGIDVSA